MKINISEFRLILLDHITYQWWQFILRRCGFVSMQSKLNTINKMPKIPHWYQSYRIIPNLCPLQTELQYIYLSVYKNVYCTQTSCTSHAYAIHVRDLVYFLHKYERDFFCLLSKKRNCLTNPHGMHKQVRSSGNESRNVNLCWCI